jgi:hypothetical protein
MAIPAPTCPICGGESLEEDSEYDEWFCPECDYDWPGDVVRGEQEPMYETMAVRDEDGNYSLYELWYAEDIDSAKVVKLRSGLSRAEAEKETPFVNEEWPESRLLG